VGGDLAAPRRRGHGAAGRAAAAAGPRLPEGDLVVGLEQLARRIVPPVLPPLPRIAAGARARAELGRRLAGAESVLRELPLVGLLMLLMTVLVWLLLWLP
jgi:hypothetical protein